MIFLFFVLGNTCHGLSQDSGLFVLFAFDGFKDTTTAATATGNGNRNDMNIEQSNLTRSLKVFFLSKYTVMECGKIEFDNEKKDRLLPFHKFLEVPLTISFKQCALCIAGGRRDLYKHPRYRNHNT